VSSHEAAPDFDTANILLAVFALLVITAIMTAVVVCIIRTSVQTASRADDEERNIDDVNSDNDETHDDISETTQLTGSNAL